MDQLDQKALGMQHQVTELEVVVSAMCARGVEPARCRDIIEDAVRRARRKASMLSHLDSSLLLSTLEQAKSEVAALPEITTTNAEVMQQELLHHQEREEVASVTSEDVAAASVQSLPDTSAKAPASSLQTGQPGGVEDPSVHSDAAFSDLAPCTSISHPASGLLSAAEVVAPMRDFASEVAAEAAAEADEDRFFRHALSMKASKSGDFRVAQSYDFETAMSPRAAYHIRDEPFRSSSFGRGDSQVWHPTEGQEHEEEGEEEGLLVYSHAPESEGALVPDEEQVEGKPVPVPHCEAAAPASPTAATAPRHRLSRQDGGSPLCCSSIPPGLNPMAAVEGGIGHDDERELIDPQSPTGVGPLDLHSYSAAPFTLHSVTPPRHVMDELAAEVQGRLRL